MAGVRLLSEDDHADLDWFASMVWGNAQTVLKQSHSGDIEFIDLKGYFHVLRPLFAGALKHDKILVRNEYRAALLALGSDTYYLGAYVTGQPGIGKTLFLFYLLVACLGQKHAVALQLLDGRPFYALFTDSVTFHSLNDRKPLTECRFVWALSDSNNQVQSPHGIFLGDPDRIRVIQTTSPQASRWKEWSKQVGAECYVMDIWSEEELAALATLLEQEGRALSKQDVGRLAIRAKNWGGVPRILLQTIHQQDQEIERRYRVAAGEAVRKCQVVVSAAVQHNVLDETLLAFYFLRPLMSAQGVVRQESYVCVPTPLLRYLLGGALKGQENFIKLKFFNSLSLPSGTRQTADFIYESWFHSFFSAANVIKCQWVQGAAKMLQGTAALVSATLDAPGLRKPPYYWVAPKGFPGVDSALVLEKEIFVFRVSIKQDYSSPLEGLQVLRSKLRDDQKDLPWRLVFVGTEEDPVRMVAETWAGRIFFPTRWIRTPIGWSAVDPVQDAVTFRVFHDESDPDPQPKVEE